MIVCSDIHYKKYPFDENFILEHLSQFKEHLTNIGNGHFLSDNLEYYIYHNWISYRDPDRNWYAKSYKAKLNKQITDLIGKDEKNGYYCVNGSLFWDMYINDLLGSYTEEHNHEDYSDLDEIKASQALLQWKQKIKTDYSKEEHIKRLVWQLELYFDSNVSNAIEQMANNVLSPINPINFKEIYADGLCLELLDYEEAYDLVYEKAVRLKFKPGVFGQCTHYFKSNTPPIFPNNESLRIPGVIYTHGKGNVCITEIEEGVFESLDNVKVISLPHTIKKIAWSFWQCRKLERFEVHSPSQYNHKYIKSIDGVLFSADSTELIAFPSCHSVTYEVPFGTIKIRNKAFKDNQSLRSLFLPSTIEFLGINIFYRCRNLRHIVVDKPYGTLNKGMQYGDSKVYPQWYWAQSE